MKSRILSFDILKFICSILIVFHHFQQVTLLHFESINFFGGKFYFGFLVELFFVISGFVTFHNLDRIKNKSFKEYYLSKYFRFFPTVLLTVICILFFNYLSLMITDKALFEEEIDLINLLSNILLTFRWGLINIKLGINNPLWFVSVLLLCYILFYIVYSISNSNKKIIILESIIVITISMVFRKLNINLLIINNYTLRGYPTFFFGIVICYLINEFKGKHLSIIVSICEFLIFILVLIYYEKLSDYLWLLIVFVIYPLIIKLFLLIDKFIKIDISILGDISFNVYAWHSVFLYLILFINNVFHIKQYYSLKLMLVFTFGLILFSLLINKKIKKMNNYMLKSILTIKNK